MVSLTKDKKYILRFIVNGTQLTYVATIIEDDGMFVKFLDKYNKIQTFNKNILLNYDEVIE